MATKIALAGNPNSGKTTMFNDLTGSSQYVGNWPGVTVEKKEGKLKGDKETIVQDLPGIYSLSPYTLEEVVSRNYLIKEKPDAIINIVDASNIERNLYLTTQLTEIGVPVVIALNMMDIVEKNGDAIDSVKLGRLLGCQVVETSALKGKGSKEAAQKAMELASSGGGIVPQHTFCSEVEEVLEQISALAEPTVGSENLRWYAIKLFERDKEVLKEFSFPADVLENIEALTAACEEHMDDDSESIITNERYTYIGGVVRQCVKVKSRGGLSTSDKIDRIVTNRILALPIFAVIMFLVYFLSISTVGTAMTDWVNEAFFDEGWFVMGNGADEFEEAMEEFESEQEKIGAFLELAGEEGIEEAVVLAEVLEVEEDFDGQEAFEGALEQALEAFLENPAVTALVAEAEIYNEDHELEEVVAVNLADFEAAMEAEEPDPTAFGAFVPGLPEVVENGLVSIGTADWLTSLIVDGIIAGVGAVLGFLPQMLVLFLCLAILEDCGYMARIAFIMDRIFRKFGLSGKSFIPILVGTGCGVPGIMATRTIESEKDRRMTIITTTFIPCGAKLPIIALIAGALFPGNVWVAPSAYFVGIGAIILSGIMLKKTKGFAGDPAPFVMELPAYHMPGVKGVLIHMWDRGKSFVKKAASIILLATVLIWFLSSFNFSMEMVETDESILAALGGLIAPLFIPLGWGDWRAAVATVTGLIAKENVVGTFGVLYGYGEVMEDGYEIWGALQASFSQLAAYSFLVFNLLCAPCFAAIGAVRREMMSAKWTWFAIGYQTGLAYVISLIVYQLGSVFTGGGFGLGTVAAIVLLVGIVYMVMKKPYTPDRTIKAAAPQKVAE